jgi:hypothetical protein
MAQVALVGVTVVAVVVSVDPAVGWVVAPAVGVVVEAEEEAAAVWSAVRDVQPVPAKTAMKTAVAMSRTGRMVIPPTATTPVSPGQQPSRGRSRQGHRSVSRRPRTGLDPVAIFQHEVSFHSRPRIASGYQRLRKEPKQ